MANTYSHAEHERSRRRRTRQLLGVVLCLLILVGVINVVGAAVHGVASLFDKTDEKLEYEQRLQSLVMMDPLPFASLDQMDVKQLREYSIWAAVANAQRSPGGLDAYRRDPESDGVLLPALEVDAALVALLGPNYNDLLSQPITNTSFQTDLYYEYREEEKAYVVPVTAQMGFYRAQVTDLDKKDGRLRVTVGYIPTALLLGDYNPTVNPEPSKYMDYVFDKVDKVYYLRALEASDKKPSSSAAAVDPTLDEDLTFDPMSAIEGAADSTAQPEDGEEGGEEGGEEAPAGEEEPAAEE